MTVRQVLIYPDPLLRKEAKPVDTFDEKLEELVEDMLDTIVAYNGYGLAAPQIGISKQIMIVDSVVFVNPVILDKSEHNQVQSEGCLSFPGVTITIPRSSSITVKAQNIKGEEFSMTVGGMQAIGVQHEYDHLTGKVFTDYVSRLKRDMIKRKMKKFFKNKNS